MFLRNKKILRCIIICMIICICMVCAVSCESDVTPTYQEDHYTESQNSSQTEFSSSGSSSQHMSTTASQVKTTVKKTTTSKKTTTTTAVDPKNNAKGVENPDYKSKYYIVVYTESQSTVVYGKDSTGAYNVIYQSFTCSTGKSSSPTKAGMYKVKSKYRWRLLVGNVYGQYASGIGNNYLFHSVPYNKQSASSLDNAEYDKLGSPSSHGCIRLCVRDSKWIYDNVPIGTQVNVVNSSGPAGASVPKRNIDSLYDGWDPSDKWADGNPYFAEQTTTSQMSTTLITSTMLTTTTASTTVSTTSTTTAATLTTAAVSIETTATSTAA